MCRLGILSPLLSLPNTDGVANFSYGLALLNIFLNTVIIANTVIGDKVILAKVFASEKSIKTASTPYDKNITNGRKS